MSENSRFHVLVLEDDEAYRRMIVRMLERAGFNVIQAGDSKSAVAFVDSPMQFDLLLADINMQPDTPHGLSVARRSQMRRPDLKVIYMTGGDPTKFALHARDDVVLQKPFTAEVLISAVEAALKV